MCVTFCYRPEHSCATSRQSPGFRRQSGIIDSRLSLVTSISCQSPVVQHHGSPKHLGPGHRSPVITVSRQLLVISSRQSPVRSRVHMYLCSYVPAHYRYDHRQSISGRTSYSDRHFVSFGYYPL